MEPNRTPARPSFIDIHVTVDEETLNAIDRQATALGTTRSHAVRLLIPKKRTSAAGVNL